MTLNPAELRAQQRMTKAFIEADALLIELLRPVVTDDGAGGFIRGAREPIAPQVFRLIPQEDGATARTNADGEAATPQFILMGETDCDMQRFDEFVVGFTRFQVVYIDNRQYEVKGEVIRLGD